jgi:hypothetical protein
MFTTNGLLMKPYIWDTKDLWFVGWTYTESTVSVILPV